MTTTSPDRNTTTGIRTALITGASSGLGAEYARQLAAAGIGSVLVARDAAALETVAAGVRAAGSAAGRDTVVETLRADLLDADDLAAVIARLTDPAHPVDLLINNAGFGLPLDFERNAIDDEVRHLRLHDEVPMRLCHAALQSMLDRGTGRIINIASVAGFIPRSTYSACKAWLISFSRWANARYRGRGVTVTAVCPGFTHTGFHARMGLPPGQEGIPRWMWLDAADVVRESLRDAARGRGVSVPSLRYKLVVALVRVLPPAVAARAGERGR